MSGQHICDSLIFELVELEDVVLIREGFLAGGKRRVSVGLSLRRVVGNSGIDGRGIGGTDGNGIGETDGIGSRDGMGLRDGPRTRGIFLRLT